MKLRIQNLGPVKDATIDLGRKLTVFCGPNGTGKTWAAYVVYGVVGGRTTMSSSLLTEQEFAQLLSEGVAKIEIDSQQLYALWQNEVRQVRQETNRIFPVAVDKQRELFGDFYIESAESPFDFAERFRQIGIDVSIPFAGNELTVYKVAGEEAIIVRLKQFNPLQDPHRDFFELALSERIFTLLITYPIIQVCILPVERNSIYTFSKEVFLYRGAMFERVRNAGDTETAQDILEFLQRQATRYPEAIRDALREAEDAANIAKTAGPFYDFAKYVEMEMLGGNVSIGTDGEVAFSSNKAQGKSFSFQLSSSAVKTISSLIIYLKYQAQPNDLIIIDEPELNLHPDNQILLVRLFARMINQGLRLLISTHSDYIIRELNNLIMLAEPQPALKKVAQEFGYREDEKISRDDIGVYLFHFKEPGDKHATVEPVPVDQNGFEVKTIEDTINRLNAVSEEIYYTMKYGEQVRDEQA